MLPFVVIFCSYVLVQLPSTCGSSSERTHKTCIYITPRNTPVIQAAHPSSRSPLLPLSSTPWFTHSLSPTHQPLTPSINPWSPNFAPPPPFPWPSSPYPPSSCQSPIRLSKLFRKLLALVYAFISCNHLYIQMALVMTFLPKIKNVPNWIKMNWNNLNFFNLLK